ncbi:hypothetical protein VNO78_15750 [Psophocarpus tetragonolobus]|uniref:Uncharacterized protein n=1 Tax=Psophocarpus tetragonolobus TaxID=3891 RepID=A0AAN9XJF7_PSOTE
MDGRKKMGSSSFTSELFGSDQSQKSTGSGIFESMFPPPFKVLERGSLYSEVSGKTATEGWNSKIGNPDYFSKGSDDEAKSTTHKDMSSTYQEQRGQPCQLSSSIHYGGPDNGIYSRPKSTQLYKKDRVEDDFGSWWQVVCHKFLIHFLPCNIRRRSPLLRSQLPRGMLLKVNSRIVLQYSPSFLVNKLRIVRTLWLASCFLQPNRITL